MALRDAGAQRIVVLPLFPQYSGTTTAATYDQVGRALRQWRFVPELHYITDYHAHDLYIEALAHSVHAHRAGNPSGEHLLITFHGIPKGYVDKGDPYFRKCQATAQALVKRLNLAEPDWSLSFQSRVGRAEWLGPYTDQVIAALAKRGVKNLDVICPGFSVDCLETIDEIAHEGGELFRAQGGKSLRYVPALNATDAQVDLLRQLLTAY
jgi:protoporphyrin/coproporphyrin ferrochelatase